MASREAARLREVNYDKILDLRKEAFKDIPAEDWRFENVPTTPQLEKLKRYAAKWDKMSRDNTGLVLFGNVGTGKSYAAGCIANEVIDKFHSVGFVGFSDVVNRMQGKFGDERDRYIKSLVQKDLLILDDLGTERTTSFGREQTFDIINSRILTKKPLIITTNIPLQVMKTAEGISERRIFDRILENCVPIRFDGENFRRKTAEANINKMIKLMN